LARQQATGAGSADEPVGERVYARSFASGNRVTTTRARMSRLNPSA
jgi:hypothetical protein